MKSGSFCRISGNAEAIGQDMLDAAQIALLTVGRTDMVLLPRDTGGTTEGATAAAARSAIVPVRRSSSARSSAPRPVPSPAYARQHGLKVISFSNDASVAGGDVWVLGFRPEEQVERVVHFARRQGLTRLGALAPDDAYGRRVINGFTASLGPAGAAALAGPNYAFYPPDEREAARVVREFTGYRAPPEGSIGVSGNTPSSTPSLLADGGTRQNSIAAQLAFYDIDPATHAAARHQALEEDPRLLSRDPAGWLVCQRVAGGERDFQARFESAFGRCRGAGRPRLRRHGPGGGGGGERPQLPGGHPHRRRRRSSAGPHLPRLRRRATTSTVSPSGIDNGTARVVEPAPTAFRGNPRQ